MAGQRLGQNRTAVVVGAGWAGLAAAERLVQQGFGVTVLEQAPRIGGRTFSFLDRTSGEPLDNGQHVLLGLCHTVQDLLERADLASSVKFQPLLRVPVVSGGGAATLGSSRLSGLAHLAPSILRYHILPYMERLRILKAGIKIPRVRPSTALDAQSWADWLVVQGQSAAAQRVFWDAIGTGVLNARANQVSAALALKTFHLLLSEGWTGARLGIFVKPLSEIMEGLATHLKALGVTFRVRSEGCRVETVDGRAVAVSGRKGRWVGDAIVLAVPPDRAQQMLDASGLTSAVPIPAFDFSPIVNTYLFYDQPVWSGELALLVDDLGAMVFNRTHLLGENKSATTLAVSVSAANVLRNQPTSDVTRDVVGMVTERLGLPVPRRARSVWQSHATILVRPGLESARPSPATSIKGLYLAGDWTDTGWPACIEGAALSGRAAAALAATADSRVV